MKKALRSMRAAHRKAKALPPIESIAPEKIGEAQAKLDQMIAERKRKKAEMPSRESVMASLAGQIAAMRDLGMTNAEIHEAIVATGVPIRRSWLAAPKAAK